MQTGENEQALRKILDMTRLISISILCLHFYFYNYTLFNNYELTTPLTDRILTNITKTGIFAHFHTSKIFALLFLGVSLLGAKGKIKESLSYKAAIRYLLIGLLYYFLSYFIFWVSEESQLIGSLYIVICSLGYLMTLKGGVLLSRLLKIKLQNPDVFNSHNETFPQEERLLQNQYSINLPARYRLKNGYRNSWINIINPFRGLLVSGTPGAGKTYFVIRHVITQHIKKGFSMFIYDFKYDDLTKITYNTFLKYQYTYKIRPEFYTINFDNLSKSHRCNPLDPNSMIDITDAAESARTILMGLNRQWIRRQGDFFVESPINFLTAVIWYLRKFKDGEFCTLPHVIELMQVDYDALFTLLRTEPEIEVLINPFVNAYLNDVMEQLEGQIAAAKIAMARLASPQLYYILSGNDFTLDINNPKAPKIVTMGNNPQKIQTYGAVISLYINRLIKQVNQKDKLKSSLIFDEFPTVYLKGMDNLIATARSNKVATCLGIQDFSQLRKDYGREEAEVLINIIGNIISGQVTGETAKNLSDRFGKILQNRESLSINRSDTSLSKSKQLELAIPPSKISSLSSGEFVGMVADNPTHKIELKNFHCEIVNNHDILKQQEDAFVSICKVREITPEMIHQNYNEIKQDIQDIIHTEIERLLNDPAKRYMVIQKK